MAIFNSYVSLPEGNHQILDSLFSEKFMNYLYCQSY